MIDLHLRQPEELNVVILENLLKLERTTFFDTLAIHETIRIDNCSKILGEVFATIANTVDFRYDRESLFSFDLIDRLNFVGQCGSETQRKLLITRVFSRAFVKYTRARSSLPNW